MAEFSPQAAQLRIRIAEEKLMRIFRKAALDTFNELLTEDLGSTKLVLTAAAAQPWRPDQMNRLLAIWRTKTGQNLVPAVLSLYRTSAAQTLKSYPVLAGALKRASPDYLDNIRNLRADAMLATLEPNISGFGETAFRKVTGVLQTSLESGAALEVTQKAVRQALGVEVSRARTVARTMAGAAVNGADHAVYKEMKEAGFALERVWLATGDLRTRDSHRAVNGKPESEDGTWFVGGSTLRYPGDPNGSVDEVVNCRCTTIMREVEGTSAAKIAHIEVPDNLATGVTPGLYRDRVGNLGWDPERARLTPKGARTAPMASKTAVAPKPVALATSKSPSIGKPRAPLVEADVVAGLSDRSLLAPYNGAMSAIKKVHRVPNDLDNVNVKGYPGAKSNQYGVYHHFGEISINPKAPGGGAHTLLHEFGHFLDHNALNPKGPGNWASATSNKRWSNLFNAIENTASTKKLAERAASGNAWAKYATDRKELFARAYAQWVSEKSGDRALIEIGRSRMKSAGHWDEAEFLPVMKAMDELFASLGLLV